MASTASIPPHELGRRSQRILARVRALRAVDVLDVGKAVQAAERDGTWATREAFWVVNNHGLPLHPDEDAALRRMWDELYPAVASALGEDVPVAAPKRKGLLGWLLAPSARSAATDAVEQRAGAGGHAAALGIWNAACAALLTGRLSPEQAASLAQMWRTAGLEPLDVTAAP